MAKSSTPDDDGAFAGLMVGLLFIAVVFGLALLLRTGATLVRLHAQADPTSRNRLLTADVGLVLGLLVAAALIPVSATAAAWFAVVIVLSWLLVLIRCRAVGRQPQAGFTSAVDLSPWKRRR